ncbi:MAG: DNA primase [Chloroflexota bacterium]
MSQIDEIKSRIDIVDLVSETVKLRRAGKNYSGLCPFHSEKTPSFIVSPERGTWRCFGQCGEGGDAISFVMKKEGWDFSEALRYLAGKAGVELQAFTPQQVVEKEEHDNLRSLLEEVVTFYRHQLLNTPPGQQALEYLRTKRFMSDETIEAWGLGYAPDSWDAALNHLAKTGHTPGELNEAGLVSERDSGGFFDRFRNRIMIPIRDERGRMTGFGARSLSPEDMPKFLNSPETALFSKSRLLYGLDRARKPIRSADQAVIVEGYFDVIGVHQAGFENVISPMGTALTEDQMRLLKRFSRRIVLALDPDAAGQHAVLRGLEAARQSLDRTPEIAFDARGLLRHEARLQADLRVASMPDGLDPDEVVQRNPAQWTSLIAAAQPVVVHVMYTLAEGLDLEDAKVKTVIANQVLPLIEDLPNPIERDTYRQRLARFLHLDERSLIQRRPAAGKKLQSQTRQAGSKPVEEENKKIRPATASQLLESHCLSVLLRRPELLYRMDRILQEASLSRMGFEDFGYTDNKELFRLIRQSLEQDDSQPAEYLLDHLPDTLSGLVEEVLGKVVQLDPVEERVLDDLLRTVLKMRRLSIDESINQLRFFQEDAQEQGDLREGAYMELVNQARNSRQILDQANRKLTERR